jgi:hypothetical protein
MKTTGLTLVDSKPFDHRRSWLSLRNLANQISCIEVISLPGDWIVIHPIVRRERHRAAAKATVDTGYLS